MAKIAAAQDAQEVLFEKQGRIGIITLNRPQAMNAVNQNVSTKLEKIMDMIEADDDIWVSILASSNPKVFCAGADLKAISSGQMIYSPKGGFGGLVQYPRTKPLIAAVDGKALAGGCELVLSCDLVVASKSSEFGVPEVKRSLVAAAGGLFRLPQKLPRAIAMELLLTGDPISAERMFQFGFVNVLCNPQDSLNQALKLAERIVVNAPLAVRESLKLGKTLPSQNDEQAFQESGASIQRLSRTPDFKEGPRAFIEKRAPKWSGKL